MLINDLKTLISKGESESLEFKKTTGQKSEATKTVCAFLNGLGGIVVFGVENHGSLVGQNVTSKTLEDIANELKRIEPPVFPEIETVSIDGDKKAIVIRVIGERGTYTYDGRPYLRHGPTTQIMPKNEYEKRLLEGLHATTRWENQPVPDGISIKDLDEEEIKNALKSATLKNRIEDPLHDDIESILTGFNLIHKGKLLNAALALFGKSNSLHSLYPQFSIRVARFRGKNRLADFQDNRIYWGNAFDLLRRGESFLFDHIPIGGSVKPGIFIREDYPMYPSRATREALANAICHRDYAGFEGAIAVAMYDDHLEIINPGSFHFGFTPEKLISPHSSQPWNPLIAGVFYRTGIIEQWGTGTINIIDWCKENKNPIPTWEEQTGTIVVTFSPSVFHLSQQTPQDTRLDTRQVGHQVSTLFVQTENHENILKYCIYPKSAKEIMSHISLKDRESFYKVYLQPLLKSELLKMTVPDKPNSRNQKYYANSKNQ